MRTILITVVVLSVLGILFSLYSAAYFMWLSATPLTPAQQSRVRFDYYAWLAIGGACIGSLIVCTAILLLAPKRRREFRGFPVSPK
jgi:hypothetical protein